ncbi:MAG: glycosyltransferase family 39 protein [Anaerolineae bacterium]|nr:glycosyltransferase family 39 protein [Anaerolineae bacterium]
MKPGEPSLRPWHWLVLVVFIGWLFFSLSAYFVAHKPLDAAILQAIGAQMGGWADFSFSGNAVWRSLLDVAAALWIWLAVLGVGLWLWRWFGPANSSPGETALFAFGLGFGAVGLLILGVGLAGWLQRPFLFGLLVVLTMLGLPVLIPFLRQLQFPQRPSPLVILYLVLTIGLAFTLALLPPTSWDGLSYHLRGPWLYLQAGQIYPDIDVFSLNYPFLLEMLFMLAMAVRSDITAQLMHFFFVFLLSGLVYQVAVSGFKLRDGWTAVLLLLATPLVLQLAPVAYNDLTLAFTMLASLYAFIRWHEAQSPRWLLISGLFSGLAMSLKYTSFVAPLFIGLWLIGLHWRQPRQMLPLGLMFAVPALLVALPWYVKNWAFTGNPVYPFVWDGRYWDEFRSIAHRAPGTGIGWDIPALLTLPYTLTLGIGDNSGDGQTGPLYLALLPLLLLYALSRFGRRQAPFAFRVLLLFALFQYAVWVVGVIDSAPLRQARLLLPAFVALCPALAWVITDLQRYDHPQFSLRRFINLVLAVVILFELVTQVGQWLPQNPPAFIVGPQSRDAYLSHNPAVAYVYRASQAMNETLPAQATVQFLWEPRTYYCEVECRGDHILDKYTFLEYQHDTADQIAQALAAEGVTHLLIFEQGLAFLREAAAAGVTPADEAEYERFIAEHTRLVQQWGQVYTLVELIP